MPKVLLYITAKVMWTFLFYGTDANENRAHVHVGKKGTDKFAKIWLEPQIELADNGSLTDTQARQVLSIAEKHRNMLLEQWMNFVSGNEVKLIKIKK